MRSREPEIDSKVSQSVPKLCSVTFCVLSRCPKVSHCVSKSSKEPKINSLMSHSVPKWCPVSLNVLLKCPLVSQSVPKSPKASQNGVQRLLAYFQDVPKCPTVSQKVSQSKGRRYEWLGWGGGGSRRRPAICRRRPRRHVLFDVVVGVVSQSTGVAHKPRPPHSLTHTHTHTRRSFVFFFIFVSLSSCEVDISENFQRTVHIKRRPQYRPGPTDNNGKLTNRREIGTDK